METMGWLLGNMIASLVGALLVVRFLEHLFSWMHVGAVAGAVKAGVFVGTWTAITAGSGIRGYTKWVQRLRQKTRSLHKRVPYAEHG